ncbi:hypothetical protein TNCV_1129021 [Trichonephila clavipes]|nr:hypothetical protein TNCV_1129021 [Trichonephila clavipes]
MPSNKQCDKLAGIKRDAAGGSAMQYCSFLTVVSRKSYPEVGVRGSDVGGSPDNLQGDLSQNWGGTEPNRTVTCMMLKVMANDRRRT